MKALILCSLFGWLFGWLFGSLIGYILKIREEKHERKMKEIERQANELKIIKEVQETQNRIFKEIWK